MTGDRAFVTALARGLDILRAFRPNETVLSNTALADRTGLPKATVSRLTHTLCELDYLSVDPVNGAYRLGAGVLALGFGVLAGMEISERAEAELIRLRDGPNAFITAALGDQFQDRVIYIAVQRSRENVALQMQVGSHLPLFRSAMGRAILAGMTDAARAALVAGDTARQAACEAAVAEYQAQGYCSSFGDWRADVNGIAMPVRAPGTDRVYSINIGGPAFHVSPEELQRDYVPLLRSAVQALSVGER